jgi:heme/copper-type cytochrome/quinol oxidase subunit 2
MRTIKNGFLNFLRDTNKYNKFELVINWTMVLIYGIMVVAQIPLFIVYADRIKLIVKGLIPISLLFPPVIMYIFTGLGILFMLAVFFKFFLWRDRRRAAKKPDDPNKPHKRKWKYRSEKEKQRSFG